MSLTSAHVQMCYALSTCLHIASALAGNIKYQGRVIKRTVYNIVFYHNKSEMMQPSDIQQG